MCADVLLPGCLFSVACCLLVRRAKFQRRPLYQEHLGMNKLFDQDNVSGLSGRHMGPVVKIFKPCINWLDSQL